MVKQSYGIIKLKKLGDNGLSCVQFVSRGISRAYDSAVLHRLRFHSSDSSSQGNAVTLHMLWVIANCGNAIRSGDLVQRLRVVIEYYDYYMSSLYKCTTTYEITYAKQ